MFDDLRLGLFCLGRLKVGRVLVERFVGLVSGIFGLFWTATVE